jgi:hypothetical protein
MDRVECIMSGGEGIFYLSASCILQFEHFKHSVDGDAVTNLAC